MSEHGFLIS